MRGTELAASVVVPTMGGRRRLPRLLAALAAQSVRDFEVVVVVDSDTDDTQGLLERWEHRLDLQVVVFPENRGRSAALNEGFSRARGQVLIRQDDDLEPHPHFVVNHVRHHAGDAVGVIGMCPDVFPDSAYARAYGRPADIRIRTSSYALPPEDRWRLWSANVSVTRETYDHVGPHDESFRRYGWEDVDWGYRLHRLGVPIIIPSDIEARHHNPATSTAERAARAYLSGASRAVFTAKHGPVAGTVGAGGGPWGRAVTGVAGLMRREEDVTRLARGVDLALPGLPRAVGEKAVALVVESAGLAADRGAGAA